MKKYLLLFYLQLKSTFHQLPKLILGTIIFAGLAGLIAYSGTQLLYKEDTGTHMTAALVLPAENDQYTRAAFSFLNEVDTIRDYCTFVEMSEDEAFDRLRTGDIGVIVLVPDNFVNSIMDGTNLPAQLIFRTSGNFTSSRMFRSLVNAGVGDLAVAQAGIYAVDDTLRSYQLEGAIGEAEFYLNSKYLSYALDRSIYFRGQAVSATGKLSVTQFYLCSGLLLLLLFASITCMDLLTPYSHGIRTAITRTGIPASVLQHNKAFSVAMVYFILFLIVIGCTALVGLRYEEVTALLAAIITDFSLIQLPALLLALFATFRLTQLLVSLSHNRIFSVMLLFLASIMMMFVSGAIVPGAFLPPALQRLAALLPTTYLLQLFGQIVSDSVTGLTTFYNLCFLFLYGFLEWGINKWRRS